MLTEGKREYSLPVPSEEGVEEEEEEEKRDLPKMKFVDCDAIGLAAKSIHRCMEIKFEGTNMTEFALLSMVDGEESVLDGPLYDINLNLKEGASMMLDIGDDGNNCSVSWRSYVPAEFSQLDNRYKLEICCMGMATKSFQVFVK